MFDFAKVLRAQQQRDKLSQIQFAQKLGISPRHLTYLYSHERSPGVDFLSKVRRCYPKLATEIDLFLLEKVPEGIKTHSV